MLAVNFMFACRLAVGETPDMSMRHLPARQVMHQGVEMAGPGNSGALDGPACCALTHFAGFELSVSI